MKKLWTNYYNEQKGLPNCNRASFLMSLDRMDKSKNLQDRADMLINMGVNGGDVPTFIQNTVGTWINPFFAFKLFGQNGLPVEMIVYEIGKKIGEDASVYWYEWCDFWLDTFIKGDINKIRENFITNPK